MSDPRVPEDRPAKAAAQFLAQQPGVDAIVADTRARLAYLIRAELVCCDLYDKVNKGVDEIGNDRSLTGSQKLAAMKDLQAKNAGFAAVQGAWHHICYYGEWAAQLCERGDLPQGELFYGEWNPAWGEPCEANRPKVEEVPGG